MWYRGDYFYLSELGVKVVDPRREVIAKNTWCFVDAAYAPDTLPIEVYGTGKLLFPIYITSPERSRWKKLIQVRNPTEIFMNPWTIKEMEIV